MKKYYILLCVVLSLGVVQPAYAGDISQSALDQLMELSGLDDQIGSISQELSAGVQQRYAMGELTQEEAVDLADTFQQAFATPPMLASIRSAIQQKMSEREAQLLLSWYRSDIGRAITTAEIAGTTEQDVISKIEPTKLLSQSSRVALATEMEAELQMVDNQIDMSKKVALALAAALSMRSNQFSNTDLKQVKMVLDMQMAQMRPQIETMVILSNIYFYRNLPEQDLKRYIDFLGQPASKALNASVSEGVDVAIMESIRTMVHMLEKKAREHRQQTPGLGYQPKQRAS